MVGADLPTSAVRLWYQAVCHVASSCAPLPDAQPSSITSCRALAFLSEILVRKTWKGEGCNLVHVLEVLFY